MPTLDPPLGVQSLRSGIHAKNQTRWLAFYANATSDVYECLREPEHRPGWHWEKGNFDCVPKVLCQYVLSCVRGVNKGFLTPPLSSTDYLFYDDLYGEFTSDELAYLIGHCYESSREGCCHATDDFSTIPHLPRFIVVDQKMKSFQNWCNGLRFGACIDLSNSNLNYKWVWQCTMVRELQRKYFPKHSFSDFGAL